ncbi:hypothetical protein IGI04_007045 [Brassica rapa subsp. trilocularis]|uniref:Uncharacterized protein n=1 Tax=Brassica rapa subsp. trilocularis TaxID=1813537 RepID=A0ABQ7NJU9_BRACM|nr:hypothetical protein IGI04_007045 [Brassica rapa subsp. trilocularis]
MRWRITCGPVLITRLREGTELTGTSEGGELSRDNMRNAGRAFVMLCGECRVQLMLVGFCQRRPGILKTHCFGLVAGDKCHDIAGHFSYAGSGCHRMRA